MVAMAINEIEYV